MATFYTDTTRAHYAPSLQIEPIHIEAHLNLDFPHKTLDAEVITTVRVNHAAKTLTLEAVSFRNVRVTIENDTSFEWRYDGKQISIVWNAPLPVNEHRKVKVSFAAHHFDFKVTYQVVNPVSGLYFYNVSPMFAVTDHETEKARYWLSCIDFPASRTTFDYHFTVRKDFEIVGPGLLQGERINDNGTKTAQWKLDQLCPSYLTVFAIGELHSVDIGKVRDAIEHKLFAPKSIPKENLKISYGNSPDIMNWMEKQLGNPFPFPKYYQFVYPKMGGAMENISLTTWDATWCVDEIGKDEIYNIVESVNVHEMAHSYFGDALVIKHFDHAWLKESWATFMEATWLEHKYLDAKEKKLDPETVQRHLDNFHMEFFENREAYFSECDQDYVRPIVCNRYETSWDLYDRHLYPGGAWRLRMLQKLLGDDVFWQAIQSYIKTFYYKSVETVDFQRVLEKHCHLNLAQFFHEWIYSSGYPKLKGSFEYDAEKKVAKIVLDQTQVQQAKPGTAKIDIFDIDVDVKIIDEFGNTYNTTISFSNEVRGFALIPLKGKPTIVEVDPEAKVLFSLDLNPGEDILGEVLTKGSTIFQRIWAARELINTGSFDALQKVGNAVKHEKFYGVRAQIAKYLSSSKSVYSTRLLAEMIINETHPIGLWSILYECVDLKDSAIQSAVESILFGANKKDLRYRAMSAALSVLGRQRDSKHFNYLKDMAVSSNDPIPSLITSGALIALCKLRTVESMTFVKSRLQYYLDQTLNHGSEFFKAGYVLPRVIPDFASNLSVFERKSALYEDSVELLEALASHEEFGNKRIILTACSGLSKLNAKHSASCIHAAKGRVPFQDGVQLDKTLKSLQQQGEEGKSNSESEKVKKDLEELLEKFKKLEAKVHEMEKAKEVK